MPENSLFAHFQNLQTMRARHVKDSSGHCGESASGNPLKTGNLWQQFVNLGKEIDALYAAYKAAKTEERKDIITKEIYSKSLLHLSLYKPARAERNANI